MEAHFRARYPQAPGDSDAVYRSVIRAKALDTLRAHRMDVVGTPTAMALPVRRLGERFAREVDAEFERVNASGGAYIYLAIA